MLSAKHRVRMNHKSMKNSVVCACACSATPMFFILFPGYSPSKEIEQYARKLGKTVENGNLTLISMGQGQEGPAEAVLDK